MFIHCKKSMVYTQVGFMVTRPSSKPIAENAEVID